LWKRSSKQGGLLFAIAIVAFGVEHIVCVRFRAFNNTIYSGHEVVSVIPRVPAYRWLGYVTGMFLIAASLCIAANVKARPAAILLGILFLLCVLLRITSIWTVRTGSYELLAIGGAALTLAGALPAEGNNPQPWRSSLDWLIKSGRFIFAIAWVVFGLDHFLFLRLVASPVPPWIPWHLFWAFFFGCAFMAAGVSIATKWMGQWGATLIGTMFLLWFFVLHLPRVFGLAGIAGAPHNPNEWSSAFIALAMWGGSWICAWALSSQKPQGIRQV
jgi:hypothetical protein